MSSTLAIEGGQPVRREPFPSWPVWDETEEQQLLEVLRSGAWGMLNGTKVQAFERAFAAYQQAAHGICVVNGTVALEVAVRAVGVEPGDEVITTPYTFIATVNAILMLGAVPVLVDIDPDTFLLDPDRIEEAISGRTKAIVPVHIGGQPADMDAILDIAARRGLAVVEDACQAWGSEWRGQRVGALGDVGAFSFQASKNVTAGEGGIVITNNDGLADLCWSLHNVGRRKGGLWYEHVRQGWNYRLTEWQGAILLSQLARLDDLAARREENAQRLAAELAQIPGIRPARVDPRVTRHARHIFIFRYRPGSAGGRTRDQFIDALRAEGIPCSPGYVPLNRSPALQDGLDRLRPLLGNVPAPRACPVAERLCREEAVWLAQNMLLGGQQETADIVAAVGKVQSQ